jgi:hypothetical protein
MPGVSAEQVAKVREVDLLTYLQEREPHELVRSTRGEYRTASHGSLVISNNKWFRNKGGFGGAGYALSIFSSRFGVWVSWRQWGRSAISVATLLPLLLFFLWQ